MKTALFLHGFFASGSDPLASVLRKSLEGRCRVLSPDLSIHPMESLKLIRELVDRENPDILVGNSCGSFYAQMLAPVVGIPALLGNPAFGMVSFLERRKGERRCKFPREDGMTDFVVDDDLVDEFRKLEEHQFDCCGPFWHDRVWGLFGEKDEVSFRELFLRHYSTALSFPGGHVPTDEQVREWYAPAVLEMLLSVPRPLRRRFRHFKGGEYEFVAPAYDSRTLRRMTVYRKMYGDGSFWVRPESMFFGKVCRDGKTFRRFVEI